MKAIIKYILNVFGLMFIVIGLTWCLLLLTKRQNLFKIIDNEGNVLKIKIISQDVLHKDNYHSEEFYRVYKTGKRG